ncbi:hypothetical protein JCM10207_007176 [Rhodosporidiobolus poonsookiae]
MGFWKDLFNEGDSRKQRKARTKPSSTSLQHPVDSAYASEDPTSPTLSVASEPARLGGIKRSSSPPPPVPPLPKVLPSEAFSLQETIMIRRDKERERELERELARERAERQRLEQLHKERESRDRDRDRERERASLSAHSHRALPNDGHVSPQPAYTVTYPGSHFPPTPPASVSPVRERRDPFSSSGLHVATPPMRANGLVHAVAEERSEIGSDDASSVHRLRERELARDYEAAVSRQMERLGSNASSIGGVSAVSGMSGVRGWGYQASAYSNGGGATQPFQQMQDGTPPLKVIVVGSGFAGLATAIACARQGYQVTVVERGSGLSPHGDLITLGSNCTKLLARWGLFHDFWKRSAKGGWWILKGHDGELLHGQDLRDFPQVYGAPLMQGHRAQYLGVLGVEARMQMVGFKPNTEVVEYRDDEVQPSIVTARGEVLSADLIVVCDGVNSYAKAFLAPELGGALGNLRAPTDANGEPLPPISPTPADDETEEKKDLGKLYSVHRAAMMSDRLRDNPKTAYFLDGCMRTFVGPDSHIKIAPLDDNRQVSFTYLSRSRYQASTNWRDRRPVKEVTDTLEAEGWDESLIEAVKAFRTCLNWGVSEAAPADRWVTETGKICLIGDSVHALSPLSFQGGSQAIEDGASLAVCLALSGGRPEDVPRALRAFEIMRKPRVADAQERGTKQRLLWHSYHDSRSPADLDLNITQAYQHDAELYAVANFERTVQANLDGERDFTVDPQRKKDVLRRLEVNGRNQREAEAEMMDENALFQHNACPAH